MLLRNLGEVYKKGLLSMSALYKRIEDLCKERNVSITTMCKESGASRASLSDLKMGRKQKLSADTLSKIAKYFAVTVDYLLGTEIEKAPAESGKRSISDEDIKFALFRGREDITDAMYEEVLGFADYIMRREEEKKKKE